MTDTSELVNRLIRAAQDAESDEWKAAQAIERLEQKRVEDYRTMSLALGQQIERAEKAEHELAEARAREGRVTSHLCQALGQWQMYAEMQEDCDLSSDDTPEAELYRLAHKVLDGREALAAPARDMQEENMDCYQHGTVEPATSEAERRVVEGCLHSWEPLYTISFPEGSSENASAFICRHCDALAAQQQESGDAE